MKNQNFALQEGVLKWGYDTGFNSFSYCCYPGAAFFRDDYNIESLRSYGIYVDIRDDAHMYNDNLRSKFFSLVEHGNLSIFESDKSDF